MKIYRGSGGIAPWIPDRGIRWRWVVSFTLWPLYSQGKSPQYLLDRRLGGPQSQYLRGTQFKSQFCCVSWLVFLMGFLLLLVNAELEHWIRSWLSCLLVNAKLEHWIRSWLSFSKSIPTFVWSWTKGCLALLAVLFLSSSAYICLLVFCFGNVCTCYWSWLQELGLHIWEGSFVTIIPFFAQRVWFGDEHITSFI